MADYINVTSLNRLAKRVLEQCDPLNDLIVCGEISGFTRHYKSGHLYFTLKDENASIKTVMFRSQAQLLNFEPQNGMLVLVYGRATIYERDGAFQLYADYMKPFGAGAAQMAFDALYKKLEAEGLFAPERKRPLPAVPRCIGVVTSKTGAAWQDVQNVIGRRWPMVKLLLAPVSVQGIEAEKSIVDGIRRLDRDPRPDLILVTRGGGSKEDLWVFNAERIARAAAACRRPVVSAVGHEIDTSILDYVADLRAPTPSAAAELCVPDQGDVRQKIFILQQNIQKNIQNRCNLCYNRFNQLATALPPLPSQTFLLRYLLESKDVVWQGQWKTFREMPWGEMYIKPYTGRVLTRAAFTFGTRLPAFRAACEKMQALPMKHGDAGYQFDLIGGYRMQILVWEGDDEFPPNAQVLYSDNFAEGFAAEDRVVAGDILISTIKSQM